jgi:hypothetical protein
MPSLASGQSESEEQSEGADPSIDFCDLCNKPAWFQKYKKNAKANKCKSMFCGFVRNKRKYPWYRELIPCMLTQEQHQEEKDRKRASDEVASDDDAYSDGNCPYLSQDMPNQEHIEREHGIDSHQRVKSFQRMMYGLVAKDIPRRLWGSVKGAQDAVDDEWRRLRDQDVWDEKHPRGLWDAIAAAKRLNKPIHIGRLFDICVEKSSELEHGKRKHKGRVVFGGNNVRDEFGLAAAFPEMGSGASFATASKLLDAVSLLPGNCGEQSDAPSAYTQSELFAGMKGDNCPETWIELPESQWPDSWKKLHAETGQRPVCKLLKSLYGHPLSGLFWEKHYTTALTQKAGFQKMLGWECMFYHVELQVILSVYVDDFKMAGKQENMSKAWKLMDTAGLKLDKPQPFGDYLGCGQAPLVLTKEQAKERLQHIDPIRIGSGGYSEPDGSADNKKNHPIRAIRYDMRGFLVQCIEK